MRLGITQILQHVGLGLCFGSKLSSSCSKHFLHTCAGLLFKQNRPLCALREGSTVSHEHCRMCTLELIRSGFLYTPSSCQITHQLLLGRICQAEIMSRILLIYWAGESLSCTDLFIPRVWQRLNARNPIWNARFLCNLFLTFHINLLYIQSIRTFGIILPLTLLLKYILTLASFSHKGQKPLYALMPFVNHQRCLSWALDTRWQPTNLPDSNSNNIHWRIHNS